MRSPARHERTVSARAPSRSASKRPTSPERAARAGASGPAASSVARSSQAPNSNAPGSPSSPAAGSCAPRARAREAQDAVLDDRAHAAADVQRARAAGGAQREQLRDARAHAWDRNAGRVLGEADHDEPRERRGQRREVRERDPRAAGERDADDLVEDLGFGAQDLDGARRCSRPPRGGPTRAPAARRGGCARARSGRPSFELSSRHARPRARQCAAVCSRVTPSSGRTSRPSRGAIPRRARRPGEEARRWSTVSTSSEAVWPVAISAPPASSARARVAQRRAPRPGGFRATGAAGERSTVHSTFRRAHSSRTWSASCDDSSPRSP